MNPTAAPALMGGPVAATTRGELAAALSAAGLGVHSRPSLPLMGGVLVEADAHGDVYLTGCQYECAVTVALPGAAQAPGRMVVDHSEAVRVLKALVKGKGRVADATPITLAVESSTAVMRADGCTVPLTTYDVDEYPPLPDTPRGSRVTVDREQFASELCRVKCARGTDTAVPATLGFHVAGGPGGVELAATDRYRLAVARIPAVDTEGPNIEALLPGPFLEHLIKHLTGPTVTIGMEANIASITSGDVTALVGLSGLDMPNYRRLLRLPGAQGGRRPSKGPDRRCGTSRRDLRGEKGAVPPPRLEHRTELMRGDPRPRRRRARHRPAGPGADGRQARHPLRAAVPRGLPPGRPVLFPR